MLSDDFILTTFFNNRGFKFKGKSVLAPYLELVNYSPKSSTLLVTNEGIYHPEINISDQEITHHYCYMSSLARWVQCGFSVEEPMVFSLPFEFGISRSGLKCFCKGQSLDKEQISFARINKSFIVELISLFWEIIILYIKAPSERPSKHIIKAVIMVQPNSERISSKIKPPFIS